MAKNKGGRAVIFTVLSIIFLIAPLGVWLYINRAEYFTTRNVDKLSIGLILMMLFVGLMIFGALKELDKRITIFMTLGIITLLSFLLDPILDDLTWISICALIGYAFYLPLSTIGRANWNYHKVYKNEKIKIEARKEAQDDSFGVQI